MWRILIGLGCVPGVVALYFRLTIPETPRFTMDIERNVLQASTDIENVISHGNSKVDPDAPVQRANAPKASWADFNNHFRKWENLKILIGTSYSWFALDVCQIQPHLRIIVALTHLFRSPSTALDLTLPLSFKPSVSAHLLPRAHKLFMIT